MNEAHPVIEVVWLPGRTLDQYHGKLHAIPMRRVRDRLEPVERFYRPTLKTRALEPWVKALCGFALPEGMAPVRGDVPRCDKCRELAP